MRLIDADALHEAKYHPLPYTHITPTDANAESYKRGWNDAIDAIMSEAPTIEERKKGKWIRGDAEKLTGSQRCSICHKACYKGNDYFNYCPNCGSYNGGENEV